MIEALKNIQVGDTLEVSPLFKGMSEESMILVLSAIDVVPDSDTFFVFDVFYYGVSLGQATASIDNNKVLWIK